MPFFTTVTLYRCAWQNHNSYRRVRVTTNLETRVRRVSQFSHSLGRATCIAIESSLVVIISTANMQINGSAPNRPLRVNVLPLVKAVSSLGIFLFAARQTLPNTVAQEDHILPNGYLSSSFDGEPSHAITIKLAIESASERSAPSKSVLSCHAIRLLHWLHFGSIPARDGPTVTAEINLTGRNVRLLRYSLVRSRTKTKRDGIKPA